MKNSFSWRIKSIFPNHKKENKTNPKAKNNVLRKANRKMF